MRITKLELNGVGPFEQEAIGFKKKLRNGEAEIHIFTGPNGSGKSTILHALSTGYKRHSAGHPNFNNNIKKRIRKNVASEYNIKVTNTLDETTEIKRTSKGLEYLYKPSGDTFTKKILDAQAHADFPLDDPFDVALFCYSGYRSFEYQSIEIIKEVKKNPLLDALDFNKASDNQVNQWIANMIAKKAIASENGNAKDKQAYSKNLATLEKMISELMQESISFRLETNPINVVLDKGGVKLDLDVIPDGLKSIISWLGDLLMRLDKIPWKNNTPIFERNIIVFLDEIEVHLHPKWQMKLLPILQKSFPNAQFFLSTHSPFIVNSIDRAWIYKLVLEENNTSTCLPPVQSQTGNSYSYILDEIFDVDEHFGQETEVNLSKFYTFRNSVLEGKNIDELQFKALIKELIEDGYEVEQIVGRELRQLKRITKKDFVYDEN